MNSNTRPQILLAAVLLSLPLGGCVTDRLYSGPTLPKQQTVRLFAEAFFIKAFDGRHYTDYPGYRPSVHRIPVGRHTILLGGGVSYYGAGGVSQGTRAVAHEIELTFTARPRYSYHIFLEGATPNSNFYTSARIVEKDNDREYGPGVTIVQYPR